MTADKIPVNVPNEFSLTDGKEVSITYSTVTGKPELDYRNLVERKFSGQEIVQHHTEIGTLITVVLEQPRRPEGTEVQLSVLLPDVTLGIVGEENTVQTDVKTEAILTTRHVGILLQPVGQTQTYQFLPLTGTARFRVS